MNLIIEFLKKQKEVDIDEFSNILSQVNFNVNKTNCKKKL